LVKKCNVLGPHDNFEGVINEQQTRNAQGSAPAGTVERYIAAFPGSLVLTIDRRGGGA
jgi:hypothetical protein